MSSKPIYSPVPARVMGAENLTSLDLRVLMAIGYHDRLGANGTGCFASPKRLAQLVGAHTNSVSRSITTLNGFGYISVKPNPMDGRQRIYKVIYTEFDATYTKQIGNRGGYQSLGEIGNISVSEIPRSVTENGQIGNRVSENIVRDQRLADENILEDKNKINISREAGPEGPENPPSVAAMLSMIERMMESRKDIAPYLSYLRSAAALPGKTGKRAELLLARDGHRGAAA
ncbi:helix-turn-helix domain-containing protein [Mesorhizobium sp. M4A.F.Ca.ET.022.05.2.1]|uniref:helix-turn-helix domain-containing protein n=1 Tax=Mesorhizobium sp. M4A.F.Ca.ET.022.05.2.1 TaxID=2496653 RepID=UPI000FCAF860|nr:helix-turn-helix domain-containing protein [Mesorhizobium sp. M4A.F.Ca.ET.022.05.2.1]RVC80212.1 helix-turn-helix domain-containing protein [Mesorhizobium sp. M4A.F.Ca.ET.022.05.2.1]